MECLSKATIIEGIASTTSRDSQGEVLDLNGADISPLLDGKGFVNSDHSQRFEHLVGRVIDAKKIYSYEDCETPSQIKYMDKIRKPYLWTKLELWDGVEHKEADAIASIYKYYRDKNEDAPIKLSVEGKTLERGPNGLLKRTLIKGIAVTVHPANQTTKTDVVGIVKSMGAPESLIKSDAAPDFIEYLEDSSIEKLYDLSVHAHSLIKSLGANQPELGLKYLEALKKFRQLKANSL